MLVVGDDRIERCCRLDVGPANQKLSQRESEERADHIEREGPPAFLRLGLGVEPALGCDEQPGAAEADNRPQDQPGQRSDQKRHGRGRGDDEPGEGGVGADMPDPLYDPFAAHRGQCEAGEIAAEHETGHGRLEILDDHPQGDQGVKEAVGELDAARREDERLDLRPHRPAGPHPLTQLRGTSDARDFAHHLTPPMQTGVVRPPDRRVTPAIPSGRVARPRVFPAPRSDRVSEILSSQTRAAPRREKSRPGLLQC